MRKVVKQVAQEAQAARVVSVKGDKPVLTGKIQHIEVVRAPSKEGARDGEYKREEVGRFALWPVKERKPLDPILFGRIELGKRTGKLRMYPFSGNSLNSPVMKGEVLDYAANVVGLMTLWDAGKQENDRAPRYRGNLEFSRVGTKYSVSAWGKVELDDDDVPF